MRVIAVLAVVSPCCVGKLRHGRLNDWGLAHSSVAYPRSTLFGSLLSADDYDVLATAADYGAIDDVETPRGALSGAASNHAGLPPGAALDQDDGAEAESSRA